jgi:peptidoglycan hydrolase-like protein with peptidoglycan-binding domain
MSEKIDFAVKSKALAETPLADLLFNARFEPLASAKNPPADAKVEALQKALHQLGYNLGKGGADGKFGHDTATAVKQFQKDVVTKIDAKPLGVDAPASDGRVDWLTLLALDATCAFVETQAPPAEDQPQPTVGSTTSSEIGPVKLEGFDTSDGQNGTPDWAAAAKRYGYAIIAATYHLGGRKGFREYYDALASRPMVRGGYHFWLPTDDGEAQADVFHKALKDIIRPGVDLPPSLDLEFGPAGMPMLKQLERDLGPDKGKAEAIKRFGNFWQAVVNKFGCYPIIYSSARVWEEELGNPAVPIKKMTESPLWLARYATRDKRNKVVSIEPGPPDLPVPKPWGKRNWWIHQYRGSRWVKDATLDLISEDVQGPQDAKVTRAENALDKAVKKGANVEEAKAELKNAKAERGKFMRSIGATRGDIDINRFQLLGDPASEKSGERIRWLQRRLKGQKVTVNGEWGPETADALKAYQSAAGLEPTGIVDPRTFAKVAWEMP